MNLAPSFIFARQITEFTVNTLVIVDVFVFFILTSLGYTFDLAFHVSSSSEYPDQRTLSFLDPTGPLWSTIHSISMTSEVHTYPHG